VVNRPLPNVLYDRITRGAAAAGRRLVARGARGGDTSGNGRVAPNGPQLPRRTDKRGPNPFAIVGAALAAGVVAARFLDWKARGRQDD
jgi:hypothetical protein